MNERQPHEDPLNNYADMARELVNTAVETSEQIEHKEEIKKSLLANLLPTANELDLAFEGLVKLVLNKLGNDLEEVIDLLFKDLQEASKKGEFTISHSFSSRYNYKISGDYSSSKSDVSDQMYKVFTETLFKESFFKDDWLSFSSTSKAFIEQLIQPYFDTFITDINDKCLEEVTEHIDGDSKKELPKNVSLSVSDLAETVYGEISPCLSNINSPFLFPFIYDFLSKIPNLSVDLKFLFRNGGSTTNDCSSRYDEINLLLKITLKKSEEARNAR